jgi:hypothetical protein
MLRHIISVSLAMTACATLIPTKVNAATLTVTPSGIIPRNPGDSVEFTFTLNPEPTGLNILFLESLQFNFDSSELSFSGGTTVPLNTTLSQTEIIASLTFTVTQPVKDGISDLFNAKVNFRQGGLPGETSPASAGDVVPVPEPLTIFGTATAFGCGVLFKRKSSKKTVS